MDLIKYGMTEFVFEVMLTFILQLARFAPQDGPAKDSFAKGMTDTSEDVYLWEVSERVTEFSSGPHKERKFEDIWKTFVKDLKMIWNLHIWKTFVIYTPAHFLPQRH